MPNTVTSPNMTIVVPVVLTDPGPDWASRLYTALFTTVDAHDHTAGNGKTLRTTSMTVDADFPFAAFNATGLRTIRFNVQVSNPALGSDIDCLYVGTTGDLWYNNNAGTQIQLTANGVVKSASALTGPVTGTVRTVTTTYTVDSISSDYALFADTTGGAFNVTLPIPTNGRSMVIVDVKGNFGTNAVTLVPVSAAKINGLSSNRPLSSPWATYELTSNGTDWFVSGN